MFDLLYKELRLAAHPSLYLFMLMGALLLIPAYPYGVVFFFGTLGIFQTFQFGRETVDVCYTALLPVRKRDVVKGKCLLAVFMQLGQLALSIPFALLRTVLLPSGNPVGIEANAAYYGFGLAIYGVFNLVFFAWFYRTAYQSGTAFLIALLPTVLGIALMEALVHLPGLAWLDGTRPAALMRQLPVLAAGGAIYLCGTLGAYAAGTRRFEKLDLYKRSGCCPFIKDVLEGPGCLPGPSWAYQSCVCAT